MSSKKHRNSNSENGANQTSRSKKQMLKEIKKSLEHDSEELNQAISHLRSMDVWLNEREKKGKYSKRRRSNVAVINVKVVFISSFLFYCLLLNHSFQTNPNKMTNCFKLFSLLQLYNYIAPASLFDF